MNSNPITQHALAQLNQDRQAVLVDQAGARITYILREQKQIKCFQEQIEVCQEAVNKISMDILTVEAVFGHQVSTSPNPNEVVILKAIKERNESKQKQVESQSKEQLETIDGLNASIKGCNERIARLRDELNALVADVVTVEQLLT